MDFDPSTASLVGQPQTSAFDPSTATEIKREPPAWWQRALHGAGDLVAGGLQFGARMAPQVEGIPVYPPEMQPEVIKGTDEYVKQREQRYQEARGPDAGTDWWRGAGDIAAAVPMAFLAPEGLTGAALAGAGIGALQPVTEGNYESGLVKNIGLGAMLGLTGGALVRGAGMTVNALRNAIAERGESKALDDAMTATLKQFGNRTPLQVIEGLRTEASSRAAPLYARAFAANQDISSPTIYRVLATPYGQKALASAENMMRSQGLSVGKGGPSYNLQTLDYVKRALDDQIGVASRRGADNVARVVTDLKNDLTGALDAADMTGAYAQARDVYSTANRGVEAIEKGQKSLARDWRDVADEVSKLSPTEQQLYKFGAASEMNAQDNGGFIGHLPKMLFHVFTGNKLGLLRDAASIAGKEPKNTAADLATAKLLFRGAPAKPPTNALAALGARSAPFVGAAAGATGVPIVGP